MIVHTLIYSFVPSDMLQSRKRICFLPAFMFESLTFSGIYKFKKSGYGSENSRVNLRGGMKYALLYFEVETRKKDSHVFFLEALRDWI